MREEEPIFSEISRVRRQWTPTEVRDYIAALPIWKEPVEIRQKFGGLTNRTFFAYVDGQPRYAIRVGFDQYRTRQTSVIQCTLAAHALGLGPRLVYAEPNLSVTDFVVGSGMQLEQMKDPAIMRRIIDRMKIVHGGRRAVRETISYWWPFRHGPGYWWINPRPWEFFSWQNITAAYALLGWTVVIAYFCRRTPLELLMPSLDQKLIRLGRRTQPAAPVGAAAETTR